MGIQKKENKTDGTQCKTIQENSQEVNSFMGYRKEVTINENLEKSKKKRNDQELIHTNKIPPHP